ncbi:hypothetical protein Saso_33260 [Streptomyces asoensis]|uniref:Uncharacterized protein n=1 Tax=Streptomyces asoensis TaxID=249586 RepID=A0ABQ3S0P6_9ACTN|nr:hypothetical protein GCM10010496_26600 [Streptomyces asoensis]GHI61676.1 hypothetical protein Saso_33260 [Streptomyces asoensis]
MTSSTRPQSERATPTTATLRRPDGDAEAETDAAAMDLTVHQILPLRTGAAALGIPAPPP